MTALRETDRRFRDASTAPPRVPKRQLSDHEMLVLTSALSLARDAYRKMAIDAGAMGGARIAEQFERQMMDAGKLYAELSDYPEVSVHNID